jgi:diguanylate cyclase (GGDEF)-like protein/PAS domain S-box-containing protein
VIACPDLIDGFREARGAVVAVRTEDGRILALNPAAELLLGWSASDVAGRSPSELSMWPDVATRARLWRDIGSRGCARGLDTVLRRRDGELLALQIDCETLQCAEGWVLLCWLRPRADRVDTAGDAGAEALWFRCDVQGRLLALSRPFRRLLGVDANLSDAALRHRDVPGFRARLRRAQDEGQTPIERCALTCGDGRIRWFEERLQRAGDGASLLAELRDVSAQVEQAEALRQQQALFNVLVDNCRDGVVLVQHGRVRFANAALADMLRRPLPELVGSEYMSLVHPDERAAQMARRQAREAGSTEAQRYRVRLLRGDGSTAVFEVNADAVWYEGALASSAVMRDITEESARQAALAAAERRYRELFETAPVGLFRTRLSGTILDVNQPMLRLLGYDSIEQLRAERQHATDLYTEPGERAAVLEELRQNGRIDARQLSLRARDGSLCWVSLSVREVAGEDGDTEVAGSVQDYSQRRLAELGLQRSERMYRALVEHAQVGVFVSDGERFSYANRTLCALLGTDEAELQARSVQAWRAPEHVEVAAKAWQRLRSGESESEEFESCYLRCDGARVWVSESVGRVDLDGRQQFTGTLRDITRQREVERRLRYYATHDALTGLPNRLDFQQRLDELIHEAQALGEHDYAVLFLDLDGFKLINDSLGHAAGDRLLVGLAGKVTDLLGGEALVARYGGDEFTILPYGRCDRGRAVALAQRVLDLFKTPIGMGEDQAFSSASVGVVLGGPSYREASQVLRDADTAMYRAKAAGKAGYAVFDEAMHAEARGRFELEVAMRAGLERGEFEVHYQPIVALSGVRLVGCEALIRWRHPERGLLLPVEFLAVAEESGLIVRMDSAALEQACRQLRRWQEQALAKPGFALNVNVNDRQVTTISFPDELRSVLRRSQLDPGALRIEITESVFRNGRQRATSLLQALKQVGVKLVVDDFGTGYSSLDSFAAAPFDALKIDRSFVVDLERNARHRAIIRTIIGFAADLGLSLTAEGIESVEQERFLLAAGCPSGQGYRYGKAMSGPDFERLLREQGGAG